MAGSGNFVEKVDEVAKETDRINKIESKGVVSGGEAMQQPEVGEESTRKIGELRKLTSDLLYSSEASRSVMLFEQKNLKAHIYMLGVRPPTNEEEKSLRKRLGELQEEAKSLGREREEFDAWLTTIINRDDSFGIEGKKSL